MLSLLRTPSFTSPLSIEKESRLLSTTVMVKDDSWFKIITKDGGPVMLGGLLAGKLGGGENKLLLMEI